MSRFGTAPLGVEGAALTALSIYGRNEEEERETQDPPSHPEGGAPDLILLVCARATRPTQFRFGVGS